jgi:hypothetical protein
MNPPNRDEFPVRRKLVVSLWEVGLRTRGRRREKRIELVFKKNKNQIYANESRPFA